MGATNSHETLSTPLTTWERRLQQQDWNDLETQLNQWGYCPIPALIDPSECADLIQLYDQPECFRSRVVMARHGFGLGEYQYFRYPLPGFVQALRSQLYSHLAPMANRWHQALGLTTQYPETHQDYLAECHQLGQTRPTPLLLKYGEGDYNCLHQDLYGDACFPLQLAVLLSQPGKDFDGGEFILTEQRPRMQSRAEVVALAQGDAVVFAVNQRPMKGVRGYYRVTMRHGVSRLRSGQRYTLGVIFHDAR